MTIGEGKDSRKFSRQRDLHPSTNHSLVSNSFYDRQDDIARYLARIGRRESPGFACSTDRKERNRSKMAYNERYGFRSLETRLDDRFRHWDTRAWCARGENQWSGVRLICNSRFKDECRALGDETTTCATVLLCRSNEQRYFVLGFFKKGFSPFKRCFLAAWKSANVQSSNTHTRHRYTYRYLSLVVYVHWE